MTDSTKKLRKHVALIGVMRKTVNWQVRGRKIEYVKYIELYGWKELEYGQSKFAQFVISDFRREVDEKCALRRRREP